MPRCIYCLDEKEISAFNTEHVLHRAFGGFENALTLVSPHDAGVCRSCNDEFSHTIDLVITRDSIEALLRLDSGLKLVSQLKGMLRDRVEIRLPATNEHGPLYMEPVPGPDERGYVLAPLAQVRFAKRGGGFKCISENQLKKSDPRADPEIDLENKVLFWNRHDEAAAERLVAILASYGIAFKPGVPFEPPDDFAEIETETTWLVDRIIARAVAKIAFNYLAKTSRSVEPNLVVRPMFDPVRRFVRYDEGRPRSFVQVSSAPDSLLPEDRKHGDHHVLAVKWEEQEKGHILGFVELFGYASYVVRLANAPREVWLDVTSAHSYSLVTWRVERLPKGRFVRPSPRSDDASHSIPRTR